MAKNYSVLFVTSEALPFVKVGGLADISYSLPLALREIGHDMRVMLPKYGSVSERRNRIHEINRLRDVPIPIGKHHDPATIKSSSVSNARSKVQAYITTNQKYFDAKKGIYSDAKTGRPYPDNFERFIYFSRTVIETCILLGWYPDIIHCNDWQTALIPIYGRTLFAKEFKKTKFVFTIHNFSNQGELTEDLFQATGLKNDIKTVLKHKKLYNLMRGAIHYSDYVTTVSPTYAKEMQSDKKLSNDLNSFLKENSYKFEGILNGIDSYSWDPKTDSLLKSKYSNDLQKFKQDNKIELANIFGLTYDEKIPVIGMITHLEEFKGIDLFIESISVLMKENIQIVLLGDGTLDYKNKLKDLSTKYAKKFKVKFGYDEALAHQIEAGSDMFLIPSITEACGLNAMYSTIYGTVPIVRMTGGLSDIVKEFDETKKTGTGFMFKAPKAQDLLTSVKKALGIYHKKDLWKTLINNGLKTDYSWSKSAKQYDEIYRSLCKD